MEKGEKWRRGRSGRKEFGIVMHSRKVTKVEKVVSAAQSICFLYRSAKPPSKPTRPSPNAPPTSHPCPRLST